MPGELTLTELFCFVAGDAFSLSDVMWPAVSVSERRLGVFLISTATHSQLGSDYISFSFAESKGGCGQKYLCWQYKVHPRVTLGQCMHFCTFVVIRPCHFVPILKQSRLLKSQAFISSLQDLVFCWSLPKQQLL